MPLILEILVSIFIDWRVLYAGGRYWDDTSTRPVYASACTDQIQYLRIGKLPDRFYYFSAIYGRLGFAEVLITLFAFITAPVSANLMAQAALHLRLRSMSGEVPETLERPLPWQKTRRRAFYEKKMNDQDSK